MLDRIDEAIGWARRNRLLALNNALLFISASMYLGTGGSLVFFQFPSFSELTVDNYKLIIVDPIDRATVFLTYMTLLMYVTAAIMLLAEYRNHMRWVPIIVLVALTSTTLVTTALIFEVNEEFRAGVTSQSRLDELVDSWKSFNLIRFSLWIVMWVAVMVFYWVRSMSPRALGTSGAGSVDSAQVASSQTAPSESAPDSVASSGSRPAESVFDLWIFRLVWALGAATIAAGLFQMFGAGWELDLLDAERTDTTRHFFAIVGMFMVLFGGMTLHALKDPEARRTVFLWVALQKLGAFAAVSLGVMFDVFSALALLVAAFDLFTGAVYLYYRRRV
jgi:hypothetical protein